MGIFGRFMDRISGIPRVLEARERHRFELEEYRIRRDMARDMTAVTNGAIREGITAPLGRELFGEHYRERGYVGGRVSEQPGYGLRRSERDMGAMGPQGAVAPQQPRNPTADLVRPESGTQQPVGATTAPLAPQPDVVSTPIPAQPAKVELKPVSLEVQQQQAYLKVLGYDTGKLDGISGKKTAGALAQYAKDKGIDMSQPDAAGKVNAQLLRDIQDPTNPKVVSFMSQAKADGRSALQEDVKAAQWVLKGQGQEMVKSYNAKTHKMDGVFGGETKTAFESSVAAPVMATKPAPILGDGSSSKPATQPTPSPVAANKPAGFRLAEGDKKVLLDKMGYNTTDMGAADLVAAHRLGVDIKDVDLAIAKKAQEQGIKLPHSVADDLAKQPVTGPQKLTGADAAAKYAELMGTNGVDTISLNNKTQTASAPTTVVSGPKVETPTV